MKFRFPFITFGIMVLMALFVFPVSGQKDTPVFEYLSLDDGLPQNHVFHVTQDSDGFMWFSTMDGLSKYDGFTFTNYTHRDGDSTSLTSSYINAFLQDRLGRCWVATTNGFNAWDRRKGKARRFYHDPKNPSSLGNNMTRALLEDRSGCIWIARQKGLDKYDPATNEFQHFENELYTVGRQAGAIAMNSKGEIWALGVNGIFKVDFTTHSLAFFKPLPPNEGTPPYEGRDIFIDQQDRIWMGYKHGFAELNPETREYERQSDEAFDEGVIKILEYQPGLLAIATNRSGLVFWDIAAKKVVAHYQHSPFDEQSIRGLSIYYLYIDKMKNIWLGLFWGISVTNLETERFQFIRHAPGFANYENFILHVYKDSRGGIWSVTMAGFFYQPDIFSKASEFIHPPRFPGGYTSVTAITEAKPGQLLIALRELGLFRYTYDTEQIELLEDGSKTDMATLHNMYMDVRDEHYVWLCSQTGLCRFDLALKDTVCFHPSGSSGIRFTPEVFRITQDSSGIVYFINSGRIFQILPGSLKMDPLPSSMEIRGTVLGLDMDKNILWIGTKESVYRYDIQTHDCSQIRTEDGELLKSMGLLTDKNGVAWSIMNRMVMRIDGESVSQYASPTGFVNGIGSKSADGQLFFGGEKGFIVIQPDQFYVDTVHPKIVFCGIDVSNQPKKLELEPEYIRHIDLDQNTRVFTLHFAPLHFNHRKGITFRYKLSGFDEHWTDAGANRSVTYTNLPPGEYNFTAVATTEDRLSSIEPLELHLIIHPPFYRTIYFYGFVAVLFSGLVYFMYALRRRAMVLKKEKVFAEQQSAYKSLFLANMSHEIRTPLNAIMGLNTLVLQTDLSEKQFEYATAINASCDNLLWIVNDILDQSKIESGTFAVEIKPFDLAAILHQLEVLYTHVALEKNLNLTFSQSGDIPASLLGDPIRLVQILSNLLNNAIKFTDKGSIRFFTSLLSTGTNQVQGEFRISDTGIGIPADKLSAIFESFQQVNEKVTAGNQGTGLGLSIVKHLVDKMKGTIELTSTHGIGSEFIVRLPFQIDPGETNLISQSISQVNWNPGLRILLVEDAPLNQLVATELIKKWLPEPIIDMAVNGVEAIAKIQSRNYDVVLMDVKMPVMDGLEATRRIRSMKDPYFTSLPIAGLTANVIPQQIEECLQAGMNAFIAKPITKEDFLKNLSIALAS